MKKLFLTFTIVLFSLFIHQISCAMDKLKVAASFYPLTHFAQQVGKNHVEVINIIPAGVEPHDFEPTPKDIKKIWSANVFIFNGADFDSWVEKIRVDLKKKGILTINMAEQFELFKSVEEEHRHIHGKFDPHIWLDPILVIQEIKIIREVFIKADPRNTEAYRKNCDEYIEKLTVLHRKFEEGLKSCKIRDIVVSHNAFCYLAKRYDLNVLALSGLSPDEEPSPRRMGEIVKMARKRKIDYVFFETLVTPKIAQTIAREIGAKTLVLNPIEGLTDREIKKSKNYVSVMEENLRNLRQALSCN